MSEQELVEISIKHIEEEQQRIEDLVAEVCKDNYTTPEIVQVYADNMMLKLEHIKDWIDECTDAYAGSWSSDKEFAEEYIGDSGMIPDDIPHHWMDWDYIAQELMYDYWEINGYYFNNR